MESEHVKASNEIVQNTPEAKPKDETPSTEEAKNQQLSSSTSPLMEVDTDSDENEDKKRHLQNPSIKTDSKEHSCSSATQISAGAEMKSPVMGYDPNRIPASVFSTKQGNNADWSTTSNESLFSIHLGNNSFSRDYAILFGKSGELQDSPFLMSGELPRLAPTDLPPVMEEEGSVQGKQNREPNSSPITNLTSFPSPTRLSDASGSSFAFPVLGSHDSGKNESVKLEKGDEQPHSLDQAQGSKETSTGTRWFSCFSCWPRFC